MVICEKVTLLQLTAAGLAVTCLLAAWKEASALGEQLRSSREASRLLEGREAQCVFTLRGFSENLKQAEEELEGLKQGNEASRREAAGLKSKILEGKAKVERERLEMGEAEKQNREVQQQIRSTLEKLDQVKQKIEVAQKADSTQHSPRTKLRKKLEFESDTGNKLKASGNEDIKDSVNK